MHVPVGIGYITHLKSVSVAAGEQVVEGQRLGLSGQTGKTVRFQRYQDAHLHFEVRSSKGGPAIDPGILLGHGAIGDVLNAELKEALLSGAGS